MFLAMLHDGADGTGPHTPDGVPHGSWVFMAGNACRAIGELVDGAPHGRWRVWDAQGQLRSESEWDRGVPRGRWVTWDAEGNLERVDVKGEERGSDGVLLVLAQRASATSLPI
jgi:hypothetical protein